VSANTSTKPLAAWPNPALYQAMICVANCNETLSSPYMIVPYASEKVLNFCVPTAAAAAGMSSASNVITSTFGSSAQAFSRVIGTCRQCITTRPCDPLLFVTFCGMSNACLHIFPQCFDIPGDLQTCYPVLAGCGVGAIFVALLYVALLQCMAGGLVWGAITVVIGGGAALAYFMTITGLDPYASAACWIVLAGCHLSAAYS
jgi:hypothetical protein